MPIMLSPVLTPPAGTLLSQCCAEGALADAWAKVHENAGCPGVDGVSVEAFHQQALSRLAELRCAVQEGRYRPQPLLGVAIPKRSGGQRLLSIPTLTDRVLQTAVAQLLTRLIDPDFDDASFAYRTGRSVRQATARIVACRDQGLCWVVDADIECYFDSVDHATLLAMLRRRLPDASLTAVLAQWLAAPVVVEGEVRPRRLGVPQGAPISPLLSNLYLDVLDGALADANYTEVRYADDFLVLCRTREEAEAAMVLTRSVLGRLQLRLNEEKSRVTHFQAGFCFLGVRFEGQRVSAVDPEAAAWVLPAVAPRGAAAQNMPCGGMVAAPDTVAAADADPDPESDISSEGAPGADELELIDPDAVRLDDEGDGLDLPRSVFITTQGLRLARQQQRLIVSRGQEVVEQIPLRLLDQIVVHGNAMISTAIIRHCRDEGVMLAFADANGINPAVLDGNLEATHSLLVQQVRRQEDAAFGLAVVRACIAGKLHNCRAILRGFSRRCMPETVQWASGVLDASLRQLERTDDLDVLRGHEGRAARAYFAALAVLLPARWSFPGRNRMPPRDPVNAMLSYGYAVLSHSLHAAIRLARLHAGFGHLHASAGNRPALVCDLMEEFRPLVVDAVVLTIARKHTLDPAVDFVLPAEPGQVCKLLPAAKQLFIARLEAKMSAPLACVEGSGKTSLFRMMRAQVARYARAVAGGPAYRSFRVA